MPNITYILDSFATGEIDPQMQSKVSLAKYKTACKVQRNFFTHVNGATSNRSGTLYIASTKFSTTNQSAVKNTKLIPFQFSTAQSYMLEFGDFYIRFYKNGAQIQVTNANAWVSMAQYSIGNFVTHSQTTYYCIKSNTSSASFATDLAAGDWTAQTIYEVPTSYAQSAVMQIGYTQSADTLYLAHPNYPQQTLQRINDTNWILSPYVFVGGPFLLDNTITTYSQTASAFGKALNDTSLISVGTSVTLTATGTGNIPFNSGHVGALWEVFHYVPNQSLVTTLASNASTASISCGGTYRLISNGTWTGNIQVEKSLDGGSTWLALNNYASVANFNVNTFGTEDMSNNAPPFLVRVTATNWSSGTVDITLTADPYIQPGIISITKFQSTTIVYGSVQQPIGLNNTATPDWAEGAWSNVQGFPSIVEFTPDDRLMWANSPNFPENSWLSKTSNYVNFNVSNPLVDSDALDITLPSRQINGINGLIPLRAILALTTSGEWSVESISGVSAPLTPSTVYQRVHGYEGSQGVRPVLIGNRAIFVQQLGKIIRDVGYELIYDSFVGANLGIFSNHLFFFNTIIDMAYQKNPDSIVWMVRDDGQLISMTYLREQSVVSFARHDTNGSFMCIASLSNSVQNFDEVWVVANRTNGQFIESFSQRSILTVCSNGSKNVNVDRQVFLDCATIYGAGQIVITGITNTNPIVVTAPNHGLSNGQLIYIFNVGGMTQLNGNTYFVENVTTNTFELWN